MSVVKFVPRQQGFEEIRRGPKTVAMVSRIAESVVMQAGRGYVSSGMQGRKGASPAWNKRRGPGFQGRYREIVYPETFRAMRDNAKNNTLIKLIGGPGGF